MEEFELFADEEQEVGEEEKSTNRLFIYLVAGFGAVLFLGICAFVVWAFWFYPAIRDTTAKNLSAEQTAAAMAAGVTGTPAEATVQPEQGAATETPTRTPEPVSTREPAPTQEEQPTLTATPAEVAGGATEEPTATLQPTPTRRPTMTPPPEGTAEGTVKSTETAPPGGTEVPGTGVGTYGIGALAVGLVVLLFVVRRLRQPV
jgi:cytoskeletal protein RodZ